MKTNYNSTKSQTEAYKPERPNHVRTAVKTLFFMLIYHAVSWLFYTIFLANSVEVLMVRDELGARIWWTMFGFSVATLLIIAVVMAVFYLKDGDRKRAFLAATSEEVRGAENVAEGFARYRRLALVEGLVCTLSTGALWMIPTVFYAISLSTAGIGFGYASAWGLEKFFVGFMGLCEPFQSPWIGLLVGMGILFIFHYFGRLYAHKKWAENRIRR
jgi:hypothetical protein